ncbi:ribonuclease Y [Kallipyga massiliensis]|uniref:ribonuclease Y n=1 Tax=Kallipyga massiliensis TaxID=1472764 RepID=UPI0026F00D49|nr:ribonuclease Y [Kallipyga massiliensis]
MDPIIMSILAFLVGAAAFFFIGGKVKENQFESEVGSAKSLSKKIVDEANRDAESAKKEALLEARDEIHRMKDEQEAQYFKRQSELQDMERRVLKREDSLESKTASFERRLNQLQSDEKKLAQTKEEAVALLNKHQEELERISGLTKDQAKEEVLEEMKAKTIHEQAQILREYQSKTEETAEDMAREIVTRTIQRYASDYVAESTVTVVSLPNDEMKGRIIGREGRNIRSFETISGVDLIIDDTPQAVVLSCFDPVRREKARVALEKLIADGRIHPTRIEELYKKAESEVDQTIKKAGEEALNDVGIRNMHPELVYILGKLKYRTSYGQNALAHSIEVAHIAGMLAEEVGANVKVAKRGGLLHDIGKAIDHEIDAPHVELGIKAARRYKEKKEVLHCIESHHNDVEPSTIEALLVQSADAISAARPGARRESMENYVKRLEDLEAITNSFQGIENSFAIQAGREVRIMVKPEAISEDQMTVLANEIAHKIEENLEYPGQIKINMIRQTRAQAFAK